MSRCGLTAGAGVRLAGSAAKKRRRASPTGRGGRGRPLKEHQPSDQMVAPPPTTREADPVARPASFGLHRLLDGRTLSRRQDGTLMCGRH
jgi:hypothetical protein